MILGTDVVACEVPAPEFMRESGSKAPVMSADVAGIMASVFEEKSVSEPSKSISALFGGIVGEAEKREVSVVYCQKPTK